MLWCGQKREKKKILKKKKQEIPSVGEDVECTIGGNVNWCNHYGKTAWRFHKRLKIELPYEPEISLLGVYLGI